MPPSVKGGFGCPVGFSPQQVKIGLAGDPGCETWFWSSEPWVGCKFFHHVQSIGTSRCAIRRAVSVWWNISAALAVSTADLTTSPLTNEGSEDELNPQPRESRRILVPAAHPYWPASPCLHSQQTVRA